jgi:excisionase family DNA binding protein
MQHLELSSSSNHEDPLQRMEALAQWPEQQNALAVSYKTAAQMLEISERQIYRLVATADLPTFAIGSLRRIRVASLDAWMRAREPGEKRKGRRS